MRHQGQPGSQPAGMTCFSLLPHMVLSGYTWRVWSGGVRITGQRWRRRKHVHPLILDSLGITEAKDIIFS